MFIALQRDITQLAHPLALNQQWRVSDILVASRKHEVKWMKFVNLQLASSQITRTKFSNTNLKMGLNHANILINALIFLRVTAEISVSTRHFIYSHHPAVLINQIQQLKQSAIDTCVLCNCELFSNDTVQNLKWRYFDISPLHTATGKVLLRTWVQKH